jgi:hypothetical protein
MAKVPTAIKLRHKPEDTSPSEATAASPTTPEGTKSVVQRSEDYQTVPAKRQNHIGLGVLVLSQTIQACFDIRALASRHYKIPQLLQFLIYQSLLFLQKAPTITTVFSFMRICFSRSYQHNLKPVMFNKSDRLS